MNKFGDGISWENHIGQVFANPDTVYYTGKNEAVMDAVSYIASDTDTKDRKALDCGCFVGRWVDVIMASVPNYTGVDQCAQAIEIAKDKKPYATWVCSMLWDLPFNEEFDFACTVAVLQHNLLFEQEKIVPAVFKSLKHGGVFLIMESTVARQTTSQRTHEGWVSMIEATGFKLVKSFHKNELGFDDMYIFIKP